MKVSDLPEVCKGAAQGACCKGHRRAIIIAHLARKWTMRKLDEDPTLNSETVLESCRRRATEIYDDIVDMTKGELG